MKLNNKELEEKLLKAVFKERESLTDVLEHLIVFDNRRAFLELGYSSLFDYCKRKLKYSDGAAHRRISAARLLRSNPKIKQDLLSGAVSLCTLSLASTDIRAGTLKLEEITNKSKREVETMVALNNPIGLPKEEIKPFAVKAQNALPSTFTTDNTKSLSPVVLSPATVSPVKLEERYEIKFSLNKENYENLKKAQAMLSTSSVEDLFNILVNKFINPKTRNSSGSKSDSRYIAKSVKRAVYLRDKGECTFTHNGVKCCSKHYLEFDHIIPYSAGGSKTSENIRLLCSNHNKLLAKQNPLSNPAVRL